MQPLRKPPRWALWLTLVVLPLIVYAPGLASPFYYDDDHSIVRNPHLTLDNAGRFFVDASLFDENPRTRMYRPVLLLTYSVDRAVWGQNPLGYHLTNLLLHVLVGVAVWALGRALFAGHRRGPTAAWLGATVFALHPLATEAVLYVSCRSSLLATLGYVVAVLAYVRGRRAIGGRAVAWTVLALVATLVGFASKAITITLPATLVLLECTGLVVARRAGVPLGRRLLVCASRLAPIVVASVGYMLLRRAVMGHTGVTLAAARFTRPLGHELTGGRSIASNLYTQADVFWHYVGLILWPADLTIAHHVPVAHAFGEPRVWLSVVALGVLVVVALLLLRRAPLLAFGALVLPLALSPTSSIVPLNVVMNEHRVYLPLALLVAPMIAAVVLSRGVSLRGAVVAAALVVAAFGARTAVRAVDYTDPVRLWGGAVAIAPDGYRARNHFGNALVARRDWLGAREQYRAAMKLYPENFDSRINLGEVNIRIAERGLDAGAWLEGERVLAGIVRDEPRHVLARLKLGRLLVARGKRFGDRVGDFDRAEEEFRTVARIARGPRFKTLRVWALRRLAELLEYRGRIEEAIDATDALLEIAPRDRRGRAHRDRLTRLL